MAASGSRPARRHAPELYHLLVGQRGWTPEQYERFPADAWHRLLMAG